VTDRLVERRKSPRAALIGRVSAAILSSRVVQVVDISVGGVLLSSAEAAPAGRTARLRATLGAGALAAEVVIKRVQPAKDAQAARIGAEFTALDAASRQAIERFLRING
jgi:hypothetical protein